MKKRLLSILLLFAILVSFLPPMQAEALTVSTPKTSGTTSSYYFTAFPTVLELGDCYGIVWATSFAGSGYVKYSYNGTQYTAYSHENGYMDTEEKIHVVQVPKEHFQNTSYTVYSQVVTGRAAYAATLGTTISCGPIAFQGYAGQENIELVVFTDVHGKLDLAKTAAKNLTATPDLMIFSGDITSYIQTEDTIVKEVFAIMGTLSGGKCPVVYMRGNHETRGQYAPKLKEYFPTSTGEFYYTFDYGPISFLVTDTGEDKVDSNVEYGGLVDYEGYKAQQMRWLETVEPNPNAQYRIGLHHIQKIEKLVSTTYNFVPYFNKFGTQLSICGHTHTKEITTRSGAKFPTVIAGGVNSDKTTYTACQITLSGGNTAHVKMFCSDGTVPLEQTLSLNAPGASAEGVTLPKAPALTTGKEVAVGNGAASDTSGSAVSITAGPAVFESGGDWYNVVWSTNVAATGCVNYSYNGVNYSAYDEVAGNRRSYDTIHTVKVPKEHLDNNSYTLTSVNMVKHQAYAFTKGKSVTSGKYYFRGAGKDESVELLVCPDVKVDSTDTYLDYMKTAVSKLGSRPALIVLNGDMAWTMASKADFAQRFIKPAAEISNGSYPIAFARGNMECRGPFASQVYYYVPTATGEFYYDFTYGNYRFIVLDTAEDKVDSNEAYYGLTCFEDIRAKELKWLSALEVDEERITIAISQYQYLANCVGTNFMTALKAKNTKFILAGNSRVAEFKNYDIPTMICGGLNSTKDASIATKVTLSGDYAHIKSVNNSGTSAYEAIHSLSGKTTVSAMTAAAPSKNSAGAYEISKAEHLLWLSQQVAAGNTFAGVSFVQTADIDLKLQAFTPIGGNSTTGSDSGTTSSCFSGTYDGNGFEIQNLRIESSLYYVGLFGYAKNATIKNVILASGQMTCTGYYAGALVGFSNGTKIINCRNAVTVCCDGRKFGGLVGFMCGGTSVTGCYNEGTISSTANQSVLAGGIVGQTYSGTNSIIDCYNRGNVLGIGTTPPYTMGGILGYCGAQTCTVQNCYNAAFVIGAKIVGQVIGSYNETGKLNPVNCYYDSNHPCKLKGIGVSSSDTWTSVAGSGTIIASNALKTSGHSLLNASAFELDDFGINDGYPILSWAAPLPNYTVNFTDESGKVLQSLTVRQGNAAVYTGAEPTKAYDESSHYSFAGWADAEGKTVDLSNIMGDLTVHPVFTATAHDHNNIQTENATCDANGKQTATCTCGHSVVTVLPATGHSYTSEVTAAPTCTEAGVKTYTCANCGDSYTEAIAAIGHSYTSKVTTAPTCTVEGIKTYTCGNCGDTYTETIPVIGHTVVADAAVAPTCTNSGLTEGKHCAVCGIVLVAQEAVARLGHDYTYTDNGDGTHLGTCSRCDKTVTKEHEFADGVCDCGAKEIVLDETIKIYHTLDLASDISITFAVPMSALSAYENYYLECVLPEYEGNVQTGSSTVQIQPIVSGSYYYFTLTGITAVRMGDMVEAVLHMTKDNTEYISKTDSYSVATYAYAMLNSSNDTKMLALCADLLRYGAEAQSFKGYRTDSLVDANMTDAHRAYLSDTNALSFTATDSFMGDLASPVISWVGKTLDLGSKVGMKFVFNAKSYGGNIDNLSMKVTYTGSTGEVKTVTLTGAEVYSSANSYYSFTFYGLLASELRTVVDVAIYEGESQLSETLRYSAETYASKTVGTTLEALTRALFAYSDSAKAYFTK